MRHLLAITLMLAPVAAADTAPEATPDEESLRSLGYL